MSIIQITKYIVQWVYIISSFANGLVEISKEYQMKT